MLKLWKETNTNKELEEKENCLGQEIQGMRLDYRKSVCEISAILRHVLSVAEQGNRWFLHCVVPTVKHGGGGVMMWRFFSGSTFYSKLKADLTSMVTTGFCMHGIPSGRTIDCFSTRQWPQTHHQHYITKKESNCDDYLCCIVFL